MGNGAERDRLNIITFSPAKPVVEHSGRDLIFSSGTVSSRFLARVEHFSVNNADQADCCRQNRTPTFVFWVACVFPIFRKIRNRFTKTMASAVLACVAGAKGEGEGGGRKSQKRGKGNPLLFSLPPFPSTLSTPATQAIAVQNRIYDRLQPCVSEMSSRKVRRKVGNFKLKLIKIQASAIIVNRRAAVIKPVVQQGDVGNTQYRNTVRKIGKC